MTAASDSVWGVINDNEICDDRRRYWWRGTDGLQQQGDCSGCDVSQWRRWRYRRSTDLRPVISLDGWSKPAYPRARWHCESVESWRGERASLELCRRSVDRCLPRIQRRRTWMRCTGVYGVSHLKNITVIITFVIIIIIIIISTALRMYTAARYVQLPFCLFTCLSYSCTVSKRLSTIILVFCIQNSWRNSDRVVLSLVGMKKSLLSTYISLCFENDTHA